MLTFPCTGSSLVLFLLTQPDVKMFKVYLEEGRVLFDLGFLFKYKK